MKKLSLILAGLIVATFCFCQGLVYPEYIEDIDGNYYTTVTIGDQVWTLENLRTTKYNDGTPITKNALAETWATGTEGKYCYFYNVSDLEFIKRYGALYNWYAVNSNKLAPKGWHVSTDEDWYTLQDYLIENGYNYDDEVIDNRMARSLAAKSDWEAHTNAGSVGENLESNNKSGFSALPGGYRDLTGMFKGLKTLAAWWTPLEYNATEAYTRGFTNDGNGLARINFQKNFGFYVRLVRDLPATTAVDVSSAAQTSSSAASNSAQETFANTSDISADWTNCNENIEGYFYSVNGGSDGAIYVAGSNGLLKSNNRGSNWQVVLPEVITSVKVSSSQGLFAGGKSLYHSINGEQWTMVQNGSSYIEGIVELNSGKVLAIAQDGTVYSTINNGQNWKIGQLPGITGNPAALKVLSVSGTILVGGEQGNLLRSTDEGETWTKSRFPGTQSIIGLWSPPGNPSTIYSIYNANDKGCLARSNDGGVTWSYWLTFSVWSAFSNGGIWGTSSNDFYLMFLGELMHTQNGGASWDKITNSGAFNLGISAVGNDTYLVGLNYIRRMR